MPINCEKYYAKQLRKYRKSRTPSAMSNPELAVVSAGSFASPILIQRAGPSTRIKFVDFHTVQGNGSKRPLQVPFRSKMEASCRLCIVAFCTIRNRSSFTGKNAFSSLPLKSSDRTPSTRSPARQRPVLDAINENKKRTDYQIEIQTCKPSKQLTKM
jgi:hypothetical protein